MWDPKLPAGYLLCCPRLLQRARGRACVHTHTHTAHSCTHQQKHTCTHNGIMCGGATSGHNSPCLFLTSIFSPGFPVFRVTFSREIKALAANSTDDFRKSGGLWLQHSLGPRAFHSLSWVQDSPEMLHIGKFANEDPGTLPGKLTAL